MIRPPTFADCPPEARWMAKNLDKEYHWFENKPRMDDKEYCWKPISGRWALVVSCFDDGQPWQKSLKKRGNP